MIRRSRPGELVIGVWLILIRAIYSSSKAVITTILPPSDVAKRLGAGNAAILGSMGPVSTLIQAWWLVVG